MFKFTKNNTSRDLKTWWYSCSDKASHGCKARAIIHRNEVEGEDGTTKIKNTLIEGSTPELHAKYHIPDQAGVLADHVMVWVKAAIDKDQTAPVGVYNIHIDIVQYIYVVWSYRGLSVKCDVLVR